MIVSHLYNHKLTGKGFRA